MSQFIKAYQVMGDKSIKPILLNAEQIVSIKPFGKHCLVQQIAPSVHNATFTYEIVNTLDEVATFLQARELP
jgi:hypothetical protein